MKTVKKPMLWNIAILTVILAVVLAVLSYAYEQVPATVVSILVLIYLCLVLACLINALYRQLKYNIYSYNVIYYTGFSVFVFLLLTSHELFTMKTVMDPGAYSALQVFTNLSESIVDFMAYSLVFVIAFAGVLIISNILLLRKEGVKPVYFASMLVAILLIGIEWLFFRKRSADDLSIAGTVILTVISVIYIYFECMVTGSIAAVGIAAKRKPDKDRDFILILGCGLNEDGTPGPILTRRLDEALRFYQEQIAVTGKTPLLIPTGGKGSENRNSESEAMTGYLLEHQIPAEDIIKEDRSTTTWENMVFSKEIIYSRNPDAKISFTTSDFHVFRSGIMAGHAGMKKAVGIGAGTEWYFWPNAILREYLGLITSHVLKQILVLLGILLIYLTPVVLSYLM